MVDKKRPARRKPKQPNMLLQGCESAEKIELLLSFTKINSDQVIRMLNRHYVDGVAEDLITSMMDAGNWSRAVTKINTIANKIERIKELDNCIKVIK